LLIEEVIILPSEAKIKDFMISLSDYPTISINKTLGQAVKIMSNMSRENGYRWVIVLDESGKLAGFLTMRNVFECINDLIPELSDWMAIYTKAQLIKYTTLDKCIRPLINISVQESEHPVKAADIILKHRITILPVINEQSEVVGIIRPVDIMQFIDKLFND